MDMFYAAVEIRDRPELADKPVAVGSMSMLSTANYVARKFGVRSAMPGFIGKKLCPDLVIVDHNGHKYKAASKIFKGILTDYDPDMESMGLDEASMDITRYLMEKGLNHEEGIQKVGEEIRRRIFEATQLTCSAGIACNKMLAKISSDLNKPNGQTYLKPDKEELMKFMNNLSVRKIPGIGRMTEMTLASLGILKCADILEKAPEISIVFSEKTTYFLFRAALGIARNYHDEDDEDGIQKSISISSTFRPIVSYE